MSELISRQNDLLHRIAEYFKEWDGSEPAPTMEINIDDLRFIAHLNTERCALQGELSEIKSQPPADQWIPCSERLPDESGYYEVTILLENGARMTRNAWLDKNYKMWMVYKPVIAWRERLEPYKGE